jgi:hypothetical protein
MEQLTSAQDAIQQAIEGGWRRNSTRFIEDGTIINVLEMKRIGLDAAMIDPEFWQALGKARGWKKTPFPSIQRCALTREGVEQFKNTQSHNAKPKTTGRVLGESRDKQRWTVQWDGHKSSGSYHKDFIQLFLSGDWKDQAKLWFETRLSNGDEQAFWLSLP